MIMKIDFAPEATEFDMNISEFKEFVILFGI
jgi:hypothetical protein